VCFRVVAVIFILALLLRLFTKVRGYIVMADPNVTVGKKRQATFIKRKTVAGITTVVPIDGDSVAWSADPSDAVAFESIDGERQRIFVRGLRPVAVQISAEADGIKAPAVTFTVSDAPEEPTFDAVVEFDGDELP
jgi:hypothetical protein